MFTKTYQATHPDMMADVSNEQLRERYLVTGLFAPDQVALNYSHNERFVAGGAAPVRGPVALPAQTEPQAGVPFLAHRELGIVNVGAGDGVVRADKDSHVASQGRPLRADGHGQRDVRVRRRERAG
jgi:4-deoxy-L-threo-5-hexosulose-uronate ketol-isomerase